MTRWTAVVPIKPPHERKTRLRRHLTGAQVDALTEAMLAHVLAVLGAMPAVGRVAIVGREPPVGPELWFADRGRGLNAELAAVAEMVPADLLVVHADLPGLAPADILALVEAAEDVGTALAPDRADEGTNALAIRDARGLPFAFGPDSLRLHRAALPAARVVRRPGLALDVDRPEDLRYAVRHGFLGEEHARCAST